MTYPLSLVSLRIAAGLPRFCIHMYPICIYSPCMSPFFDQNYGSKSEPVLLLVWRYRAGNASRKSDCNNLLQIAEKTIAMRACERELLQAHHWHGDVPVNFNQDQEEDE